MPKYCFYFGITYNPSNEKTIKANIINDMSKNDIRDRIEALLIKRGESASALARRCGLQPSSLLKILSGKATPRNSTISQLALALGVEPEDLIGEGELPNGLTAIKKTDYAGLVPLASTPQQLWNNDIYKEATANPETVWVPLPAGLKQRKGEICALKVDGDALAPRIRHGDTVFLEYKDKPEFKNDSYVLAFIGTPVDAPIKGGYVLRKLIIIDGNFYLRCDNPELPKELVRGDPVATVVGLTTTHLP